MNAGKWIVAGVNGGLVGAAIWAAVGYFGNVEVGWIAWAIGALVGFCVRYAAGDTEGFRPGIFAAVIALGSVILGKFLVVYIAFARISAPENISAEQMISGIADEVAAKQTQAGKKLQWPKGVDPEAATEPSDYPADVWQEASRRWSALSADEQARQIEERKRAVAEFAATVVGPLRDKVFQESFGPFDLLWIFLATVTAFKLGSGMVSSE